MKMLITSAENRRRNTWRIRPSVIFVIISNLPEKGSPVRKRPQKRMLRNYGKNILRKVERARKTME